MHRTCKKNTNSKKQYKVKIKGVQTWGISTSPCENSHCGAWKNLVYKTLSLTCDIYQHKYMTHDSEWLVQVIHDVYYRAKGSEISGLLRVN